MIIKHFEQISYIKFISLIGLVSLIGIVSSCSKSDDESYDDTLLGAPIAGVSTYATHFEEDMLQTRAWTPKDDPDPNVTYVPYEEGDTTIAIAFTKNGEDPLKGHFFKSSDQWRTNVDFVATDYYLYGYIPNLHGVNFSVKDLDGTNAAYSAGATVTLDSVPSVLRNDLCVVIGAKDGTDKEHDNGLYRGDFKYTAKALKDGEGKPNHSNFVFLLFDHLYAAIRINMRVYGEYDKVRKIRLKSLKLNPSKEGDVSNKEMTKITVKLTANNTSTDPVTSITYSGFGKNLDDGLEFWSKYTGTPKGELLTTTYQSFIGHFMPHGVSTLVLTSTYDVYDTKGTLVRENCVAVNTMKISQLLSGQTETARGKRYTINMTVRPTYLYMLSEPDLDSPTVVVN